MAVVWKAERSELDIVAGLLAAFRDHWGRSQPVDESIARSVERLVGDPATDFLLGACNAGAAASGVCQLRYRHSVWTGADDCWLEDIFVVEAARGTGLGAALLSAAIEGARERGARRVQLDTDEGNAAARGLYESRGFRSKRTEAAGRNLLFRLDL